MGAISATDIISIIQGEIENINWDEQSRETGEVIWVVMESLPYTELIMQCMARS